MRDGGGTGSRNDFTSGCYGKIPVAGDFVARRIPGAFCDAWGAWLQGALQGARARLGSRWPEDFLSMTVWRFVVAGGVLAPNAWAGVMAPSVDSVGRYFPLTLASALPSDPLDVVATLFAARRWFDDMEQIAFSAIGPHADVAALDAHTAARPFPRERLRSHPALGAHERLPREVTCMTLPQARGTAPKSAWLAEASEIFGCTLLVSDSLPAGEPFCAMMDGRWTEHGWAPGAAG